MVHTGEDYSEITANVYGYTMEDMAELAARLGSISLFDRRGTFLWWDDFEGGVLLWQEDGTGTGAAAALDATRALMGSKCCKVTFGAEGDSIGMIKRYLAYPAKGKIGYELAWVYNTNIDYTDFLINLYDGTNKHAAGIRFDYSTDKLQYLNSSGTWSDIATSIVFYDDEYLFYILKFVTDFSEENYLRCILNNVEYDLSSYSYQKAASGSNPFLEVQFKITNKGIVNRSTYVDNFILTHNEPS